MQLRIVPRNPEEKAGENAPAREKSGESLCVCDHEEVKETREVKSRLRANLGQMLNFNT
jgi:hypothetical protein